MWSNQERHKIMRLPAVFAALSFAAMSSLSMSTAMAADDGPAFGPQLEGFEYPWPVSRFSFSSQGEAVEMAYMDVKPVGPANGRTAVLFHGKNFCAATWQDTIAALIKAGYRVIAVDQIGFCKSTKPAHYQYTFQQLAGNTHALLASLGVTRPTIIGHSIGGMLAMRYALTFPGDLEQLVLVDPIGLEDWEAKGVPWQSIDTWYKAELKTTADSIRAYQRSTYYAGTWDEKYERWVQMLAGLYRGPGHDLVAWNAALTDDMALNQPVYYQFEQISVAVLLIVGDKDNTAVGKNFAPPDIRPTLGNYPVLAKSAAARFPKAHLIEFPDFGHAPQIQAPDVFHKVLLDALQSTAGESR
jgi:pimeloyl-ACP methyl ester carboxylesterase